MSDQSNDRIVKSLRFVAKREAEEGEYHVQEHIDWMAADRIERQAKRIEELEGAIKTAKGFIGPADGTMDAWIILSKALEGEVK